MIKGLDTEGGIQSQVSKMVFFDSEVVSSAVNLYKHPSGKPRLLIIKCCPKFTELIKILLVSFIELSPWLQVKFSVDFNNY